MKSKLRIGTEIVQVETVPFATLEEQFNVYQPNVPEGHPLHGVTIKVKSVAKQIAYLGQDDLGNPKVGVTTDTVIGLE